MQPDGVKLWYFKFRLFNLTEIIVWKFESLRSATLVCNEIGIRKSEFVAKTQFLFKIKNIPVNAIIETVHFNPSLFGQNSVVRPMSEYF